MTEKIVKCTCGLPMRANLVAAHQAGCHRWITAEITPNDVQILESSEEFNRELYVQQYEFTPCFA